MTFRQPVNTLLRTYNSRQTNNYKPDFNSNPLLNRTGLKDNELLEQSRFARDAHRMQKFGLEPEQKNMKELDVLRNIIIQPIKIEKKNNDVHHNYEFAKSTWEREREVCWALKTNTPYKNIIPQKSKENPHGFDYTQKLKKGDEKKLIIHSVTKLDRNKDEIENKLSNLEHKIKKMNKKHDKIYAENKYLEHKHNFDYEHIFYYKNTTVPKDHADMKETQLTYHIQRQKERDDGMKAKDVILNELLDETLDEKITTKKKDMLSDIISSNMNNTNIEDIIDKILNVQQEISDDESIKTNLSKSNKLTVDEEISLLLNPAETVDEFDTKQTDFDIDAFLTSIDIQPEKSDRSSKPKDYSDKKILLSKQQDFDIDAFLESNDIQFEKPNHPFVLKSKSQPDKNLIEPDLEELINTNSDLDSILKEIMS